MANILSKAGITDDSIIKASHITQSIDALTAAAEYNISISNIYLNSYTYKFIFNTNCNTHKFFNTNPTNTQNTQEHETTNIEPTTNINIRLIMNRINEFWENEQQNYHYDFDNTMDDIEAQLENNEEQVATIAQFFITRNPTEIYNALRHSFYIAESRNRFSINDTELAGIILNNL